MAPTLPHARYGIGTYLVALILLAVVPLFLIAALLVARQGQLQRAAFDQSLLQTSRALLVAVDRQLALYEAMLATLAEDDALARNDLKAFHDLASRVAERHGAVFISLFDASGRQLFNTLRPAGAKLPTPFSDAPPAQESERPPIGDAESIKRVLQTGRSYDSDLFWGLVAGRLIFTVNVPIVRDGEVRYVLNAAFTPAVMTELLQRNPQFRGTPSAIFDRRGFILGRWSAADKFVGRRTTAVREGKMADEAGLTTVTSRDGAKLYLSYARSPVSGWGVTVGTPLSAIDAHSTWLFGGLLAAGALALGVASALLLAARLSRSISTLAAAASRSEAPDLEGLRTREIVDLGRALGEAAAARNAQALERESRLVAEARKAEAEQASQAKDHFIAVLSHELRNPLAPIRNGVSVLRGLQQRGGDAASREIVDILDRQSRQLETLVNDLLDVSRIGSGKIELKREPLDLRAVARHAAEAVQPRMAERKQRFVAELPGEPLYVLGDFARLSQIVSNLLDNAAKFTPPAGEIRLHLAADRCEVRLAVSDTGRGIDPALLPNVFTAYLQGDERYQQPEGRGLGLGLSLARTLAQLHGGSLEARSEGAGRGSTFELRLPRVAAPAKEPAAPADRPVAPATSRRVLIVDDNVDSAVTTQALLNAAGYATRIVHDGASALPAAVEFAPDVALLDIGMPGMNGYDLARRLRAELGTSVHLVALTGWGQESDRRVSREAGFDEHLVKPASPASLLAALGSTRA